MCRTYDVGETLPFDEGRSLEELCSADLGEPLPRWRFAAGSLLRSELSGAEVGVTALAAAAVK
jgi:hypothetical protein